MSFLLKSVMGNSVLVTQEKEVCQKGFGFGDAFLNNEDVTIDSRKHITRY